MKLKDLKDANIKSYHDHISLSEAKKLHKENLKKMEAVMKWRENPGRPLSVLLIHGSSRNTNRCSAEQSSSRMLLERGFELAKDEFKEMPVDDNSLVLNEMYIEYCNNCVSTASALCHFTCTCHPQDDLSRSGYQMVMWADVLLFSTGVNQSMPNARLANFLQRLISLDGGYYLEDLEYKTADFKNRMIATSLENPVYDQRLFGRVAGYIVTSKDLNNAQKDYMPDHPLKASYEDLVVGALVHGNADYGIFHAEPSHYVAAADPDVEYSKDKVEYDKENHIKKSKDVCLAAMKLGAEFRSNPPKFKAGGRINRT